MSMDDNSVRRVVIIGGSDAAIMAGLRAKELAPEAEVTLVVADAYPNYSICGIPYYIGGDVPDWHSLAHRTEAQLQKSGLRLRLRTRATCIDVSAHQVAVVDVNGHNELLDYDKLVVATGAVPKVSGIAGICGKHNLGSQDGVHLVHSMDQMHELQRDIDSRKPRTAIIVGAGYIGLEMAEALNSQGISVTLLQRGEEVLSTLDPQMGEYVREELLQHHIAVHTNITVNKIERTKDVLEVRGTVASPNLTLNNNGCSSDSYSSDGYSSDSNLSDSNLKVNQRISGGVNPKLGNGAAPYGATGKSDVLGSSSGESPDGCGYDDSQPSAARIYRADLVIVVVGVKPRTMLLTDVGAAVGAAGAIVVDDHMRTSLPDIFAAGDMVITKHKLLGSTWLPLGTNAHKQGRIAGENAVGGNARFSGSLGAQVVKVCELVAARTGLNSCEARASGLQTRSVTGDFDDHKAYYHGATTIHIRLIGEQNSGRLVGAQLVGSYGAEVAKRLDVLTTAISAGLTIPQLLELDLSYTPPLSSPWDPIQSAAMQW